MISRDIFTDEEIGIIYLALLRYKSWLEDELKKFTSEDVRSAIKEELDVVQSIMWKFNSG